MNNIKIKIAQNAGFCFGVRRAVGLVEDVLKNAKEEVYCWGDLIHNPVMIENLKEKGLKIIDDLKDFKNDSIFIIRSHGITLEDLNLIKKRTSEIINTTCPFVKKAQNWAEKFKKQGFQVLIIGDKNHIEVKGLNSRAENQALIVNSWEDLMRIKNKLSGKIRVICQTTQKNSKLEEIVKGLKKLKADFKVENTICLDATQKQQEVMEIEQETDLLVVIGGLHSSNTTKLVEIGRAKKIETHHIERAGDISQKWFSKDTNVFLTAGASTHPNEIIKAKKIIENFGF